MFLMKRSIFCISFLLVILIIRFEPVQLNCTNQDPFPTNVDVTALNECAVGIGCSLFFYTGNSAQQHEDIEFLCVTGCNNTFKRYFTNDSSISEIAANNPQLLIHGFFDGINGWITPTSKFLACQRNLTVCAVDWSKLSKYWYPSVITISVPIVVNNVKAFYDKVVSYGGDYSKENCTGHSVGAHICGGAGKAIGKSKLGCITGLDPAGPLFPALSPQRLHLDDAINVEVIHTNPGVNGVTYNIGKADFWPNQSDGSTNPERLQPQCKCQPTAVLQDGCSHGASLYYYYTSIDNANKFVGINRNTGVLEDFGWRYHGIPGEFECKTNSTYPYVTT